MPANTPLEWARRDLIHTYLNYAEVLYGTELTKEERDEIKEHLLQKLAIIETAVMI